MEKKEYEVMFNIEDNFWWYVGLRKLVLSCIDSFGKAKDKLKILDAGCGTGKMLVNCKDHEAFGLDFSEEAMKFCKMRNLNNLITGSICSVPFKENSFDAVISLDVLYHTGIDNEEGTLEELHYILKKGGILILNLPAYNFLRSSHDEAIHTRHRYTTKELKEKVEKAGFKIEKITYRNTILFPFIVITRLLERIFTVTTEQAESDLKPIPGFLNKYFTLILLIENMLITRGVILPFGLSAFCVARKIE